MVYPHKKDSNGSTKYLHETYYMYDAYNTNMIYERISHFSVLGEEGTPTQAEWLAQVMHYCLCRELLPGRHGFGAGMLVGEFELNSLHREQFGCGSSFIWHLKDTIPKQKHHN